MAKARGQGQRGVFFGSTVFRREVGDLVLVDSWHAADSRLPRHTHEHAYFCVNHGGTYTEEYGRRRRVCSPGMLVFHPPGETHRQTHQSVAVASLNVEVGASWLKRMVEFAGPLDQPAEFRAGEIAAAGLQLLRELQQSDADSALAIEGLCWEILAASLDRRPLIGYAAGTPRWLRRARELLRARLSEPLTLQEVAREASVHPVYFAATFRRFYGCSVGEYLRRERLQLARRKLADPELSLADIASGCGFADQSHLTRVFKRFTGLTPGAYRTFLSFKTG